MKAEIYKILLSLLKNKQGMKIHLVASAFLAILTGLTVVLQLSVLQLAISCLCTRKNRGSMQQ